ncbi:MAG: hypothetical protein JST84_30205 [Acidobacteria bacterium]|nr:hypothetical protein [Acidobacteriota bacterium]
MLDLDAGRDSKLNCQNRSPQFNNYRNGLKMEQAPMQSLNREAHEFIGNDSFYDAIDFPTEEELLAALDASLEQSPWLPRPMPIALETTSRDLAQHWREISSVYQEISSIKNDDGHYLDCWLTPQDMDCEIEAEPDFIIDFARFLMDRLLLRMGEVRHANQLLKAELAKIRA